VTCENIPQRRPAQNSKIWGILQFIFCPRSALETVVLSGIIKSSGLYASLKCPTFHACKCNVSRRKCNKIAVEKLLNLAVFLIIGKTGFNKEALSTKFQILAIHIF
jgi:hypothetical protein